MVWALVVNLPNFGAIDITRGIIEITETILSMVNAASELGQLEALTKKRWLGEKNGQET
jgi:hypothetical protein